MGNQVSLSQTQRFSAFLINIAVFYAVYRFATGSWEITGGGETVWLIVAVASWTLSLLSAPWYRPPRDALAAAIAAGITLLAIDLSILTPDQSYVFYFRDIALGYVAIVMTAALAAAFSEQSESPKFNRISFDIAQRLSNGPLLFGAVAAVSIFGFYEEPRIVLALLFFWIFWAVVRPAELILELFNRWKTFGRLKGANFVGSILRVDEPEIIRVNIEDLSAWNAGLQIACLPGEINRHCLPLFYHSQDENLVGTGLLVGEPIDFDPSPGSVFVADKRDERDALLKELAGEDGEFELLGFVVEGSTISEIRFEIAKQSKIAEGSVVFCRVRDTTIYYQVMDANTVEESFQQNPRGTHIVSAAQLGTWDDKSGFQKFEWLPRMNAPIFMLTSDEERKLDVAAGEFELGKVAGTEMPIKGHLPKLINYHTAILGVTGTGKTELVFTLIEEAMNQGTKVICVDLTGEYRKRLAHLHPKAIGLKKDKADEIESALFDVSTGKYGAPDEKKMLKELIEKSRDDAREQVAEFLRAKGSALGLFELAEVTNTRATLIATEMYLSEIMLWARNHRKSRRILIVLEEAHTIIPETSGSGFDFDTQLVVSKIGQIALQGRKYGVGLFIVSQRTALVSKTVLSQCNTFLTHSLIDQTSLGFLHNIYESSYVKAIPNLKFLHFIASGQGVVSERPVLLARPFDEEKEKASAALDEFEDINVEIAKDDPNADKPDKGIAPEKIGPSVKLP